MEKSKLKLDLDFDALAIASWQQPHGTTLQHSNNGANILEHHHSQPTVMVG